MIGDLARDAQRLAAAGENLETGALMQEIIRQARAGLNQMLTVIENDQDLL